jgi:folate-dependent phosphoribosylglycinamide formyltransferase PurN
MRVVIYTNETFNKNELYKYIISYVLNEFNDYYIVVSETKQKSIFSKYYINKIKRLGIGKSIVIIAFYPIQKVFSYIELKKRNKLLRKLNRPKVKIDKSRVIFVGGYNSAVSANVIKHLSPDVIIQNGVGILKPIIFNIPKICTINLHHGIAPLIRGMDSFKWALFENRLDWLGATVHIIDKGIDTGPVLGYAHLAKSDVIKSLPEIFCRITEVGVSLLLSTLLKLKNGKRWSVSLPTSENNYKSTFSGFNRLLLSLKLLIKR